MKGKSAPFSAVYVNDIDWMSLYENDIVTNGGFSSDVENWSSAGCYPNYGNQISCSIDSIAGGQSGNCLEMTNLNVIFTHQVACQMLTTEVGKTYQATCYIKQGTSGAENGKLEAMDAESSVIIGTDTVAAGAAWSGATVDFTATSSRTLVRLRKDSSTAGTMLFDTVKVQATSSIKSKSEYTGTLTQTADSRFADQAQAYRGLAYLALTLEAADSQIGGTPTITSVIEAKKLATIDGGAPAFTRNPAVILYHIYTDLEGITSAELNTTAFQALETYCDAVPTGGNEPRYRFDYIFDTEMTVNDMKKIVWRSFHGSSVRSQGKIKPVWQQSGSAVFAFTKENIVGGSFSWAQPERPNVIRIHYINGDNNNKKDYVELRDETSISNKGEVLYEESTYFITDEEIARRRVHFWYNKFKYTDYTCSLTVFPESSKLEIYDIVTVTHPNPGWSGKKFRIIEKGQDKYGRCTFQLEAYHSGIHDDRAAEVQPSYYSTPPNPYEPPDHVTGVTLVEDAYTNTDGTYVPTVNLTYTKPTKMVFWDHARISVKVDTDSGNGAWNFYGDDYSGGLGYSIDGVKANFTVGNTVWVKVQSVNDNNVAAPFYSAPTDSEVIDGVQLRPGIVKGLRIENKYYDYTWDGLNVTIVWRGGSGEGGAGREAAGQETTGAGGTSIDSYWKYDEVQIFVGGALRHTVYTKDLKYTYIYGDGQDDFLDHYVVASNGAITFKVYRWNIYNLRSENPAQITIYNQNPAAPIGLSSVGSLTIGEFAWTSANEADWNHYSIRTGVEGDASSAWKVIYNTKYTYFMSSTEIETHGPTATIYFDVKSADLYNNESSVNSTSVQSSAVTTTHISNNAISTPKLTANCVTASKILANTITANQIAARTITGDCLAVSSVTAAVIAAEMMYIGIIGDPGLQNMLMNGGFEETDGTNAYYWDSGVGISTEVAGGDDSNKYLEVTRAGIDKNVFQINPDNTYRYFEVNEGEVYEFGGSAKSDGTCTYGIALGRWDKDLVWITHSELTGTDNVWTARSGTLIVPAGTKFLSVFVRALTADGWTALDNVYLKRVDGLAWSWSSASNRTLIDGGNIYTNTITAAQIAAGTITADKFISTLYGDLSQAMDYIKKVLGAGDEYEHDLTDIDLSNGSETDIDADTHSDYGVSIRISTATEWDDGGAVWDTGIWDTPTDSSGNWTSASMDLSALKTLQIALQYNLVEDTPASTTPSFEAIYSIDDISWGTNDPDLDDDNWENLTIRNTIGDTYRATGNLFTFQYFKIRVTLNTSDTSDRIILYGLTYLGNIVNLFGMEVNETIAIGGTSISLSGFNTTPAITVTPVGATPLVPLITAQSSSSVTVELYNLAGDDVGGQCNIVVIGA
ncbi:MAG: hypothetical protein ABID54_00110 [Pseudomonadota bacterium]